ncbi:mechanosensitive ion channel [bacterium]|nr:mechanosensitive ion channel [bacterium]
MEQIQFIFNEIVRIANTPLFSLGKTDVSVWTIVYLGVALFLLFWLTGKLNKLIVYRLLARSRIELGTRAAMGSFIRYFVLTIGFIILLQTAGINLSSITVLLGALGVGIGFGLQTITNNLISGLIIFMERPIKVGDRIEVSDIAGNVTNISMRATEIVTNDNISIIVPNSEFISQTVINWSHSDSKIRLNFPIGVTYAEEASRVREVLISIAENHEGVLENPAPDVLISEFGENGIIYNLRVWTREFTSRPGVMRSQMYFAIDKRFREEGITIPFPQRDIHIKDMPRRSSDRSHDLDGESA